MGKKHIIFTEEFCQPSQLYPFSLTRQLQDIRVGIFTIREKWERYLKLPSRDKAIDSYKDHPQSVQLSQIKKGEAWILLHANILPTVTLASAIKKLQPGDCLLDEQGGPIAYCITEKQVDSKHQIKIDRPLRYKNQVAKIQFPWDLTQLNAKEIESDFILVTKGRKSAAISKTNRVWGTKKIFIEKGAVVEGAFINAIQGPVYIGVKATIMEGSMLRGPLAIGEGAFIKMGAKIYGATTIGPNSVVGGEIKNSIFFGNSNKAHDGYLGDAVIGEWCNLGAGTSNSNIKNNAGPIRITTPSGEINVGLKCGVMMGDYVRTSINSSINSGAIIGPCSVLLEAGLSPRVIPPFSWGQDGITKYKWPKVIEDIKRWKALKHCAVSEWEEKMLETIYSSN
ncbi:MAG: hypothetical protein RL555_297 [Bacteroidota bacterium]